MMMQMVMQRIAIGFATLIVVSIIVFMMTSILPGDVAQIILGQSATPETLAALSTGVRPVFQLVGQYGDRRPWNFQGGWRHNLQPDRWSNR